ncbi:SMI1/KNR4 family protein [Streptomyces sp. NRRL B-24484]|uniref:SMI1/KNR4 family protein n=1 Tax=Streptomyces sp. NRRL B-24484 TaxID=1463833 RepID=UPI00069364F9|nr:SMI1/KNR4 family protein [Streptomyces sp. NRRL B-24484]
MSGTDRAAAAHDAVERLARLLPGPHRGRVKDWTAVEAALGSGLPRDYREFVERIGGGHVDGYLYVLEPDSPNAYHDLVDAAEERAEAFAHLWGSSEEPPAELRGSGARLIPWASTDNGEFLYWLVRPGRHPDAWTVMVDAAREERWEHVDLPFAGFLLATLTGRFRSGILTDAFPTAPHTFTPLAPPH